MAHPSKSRQTKLTEEVRLAGDSDLNYLIAAEIKSLSHIVENYLVNIYIRLSSRTVLLFNDTLHTAPSCVAWSCFVFTKNVNDSDQIF